MELEGDKTEKIIDKIEGKKTGVFCDGANLFHGRQKYGWQVDLEKFKKFVESCCDLKFINYYLAIPAKNDSNFYSTQNFLVNTADMAAGAILWKYHEKDEQFYNLIKENIIIEKIASWPEIKKRKK